MLCKCGAVFPRRYEIDWESRPSVVFESDDWGACELAPNPAAFERYAALIRRRSGDCQYSPTLESPADLERLFSILEARRGADGLPAVFTAFTCVGNPDFAAIRANGFTEYADIGLDRGVPSGWERGDIAGKMREGLDRGVWAPEFHSFLHHTSPKRLMERLNSDSPDGELARELFDLGCYYQGEHVPEYEGLIVREQFERVAGGVERFRNIFGFSPSAAVTSDAYPETEIVWAANGVKAICLKNCRVNTGDVVVYPTKPWNMQNVYQKIGGYNETLGAVYLTRNVFFECLYNGSERSGHSAAEVLSVIERCFGAYNEPAMVSTHRTNYVSFDSEMTKMRYNELERLLRALQERGVFFLTSGEVAELYRSGRSLRKFGGRAVFRRWAANAEPLKWTEPLRSVKRLPGMKEIKTDAGDINILPCGDYLINTEKAV
jgi:hypothetical protein